MMARKGEGPPFELGELLSFGVASTYTVHLKQTWPMQRLMIDSLYSM